MAGREILAGNVGLIFIPEASPPGDINALSIGTDLQGNGINLVGAKGTEAVYEKSGWEPTDSSVPVPDWVDNVVGTIEGTTQYDTGSLRFYSDTANTAMYDALTKGSKGFAVWTDKKLADLAAGDDYELYPVTVQRRQRAYNADGNAKYYDVVFTLGTPTESALAA